MNESPSNPLQQLNLAPYGKTARWARFLAVVGGLFSLLLLLAAFLLKRMLHRNANLAAIDPGLPAAARISVWVLPVVAVALFLPSFFLFRFALAAQKASAHRDQPSLEKSFRRLYYFFLYFGVILVVTLTVYAILFVAAGSAALMGWGEQ
ncbi:MAG: hypothetical protein QM664_01125 [Flavihumibacter sp.]